MSETQHTPGPWRAIKFDECQTSIVAELEPKRQPLVAIVSVGEGRPDGEANVALILAAPQLLAENDKLRDERDRLRSTIRTLCSSGNRLLDDLIGRSDAAESFKYHVKQAQAALTPAGGGG